MHANDCMADEGCPIIIEPIERCKLCTLTKFYPRITFRSEKCNSVVLKKIKHIKHLNRNYQ